MFVVGLRSCRSLFCFFLENLAVESSTEQIDDPAIRFPASVWSILVEDGGACCTIFRVAVPFARHPAVLQLVSHQSVRVEYSYICKRPQQKVFECHRAPQHVGVGPRLVIALCSEYIRKKNKVLSDSKSSFRSARDNCGRTYLPPGKLADIEAAFAVLIPRLRLLLVPQPNGVDGGADVVPEQSGHRVAGKWHLLAGIFHRYARITGNSSSSSSSFLGTTTTTTTSSSSWLVALAQVDGKVVVGSARRLLGGSCGRLPRLVGGDLRVGATVVGLSLLPAAVVPPLFLWRRRRRSWRCVFFSLHYIMVLFVCFRCDWYVLLVRK